MAVFFTPKAPPTSINKEGVLWVHHTTQNANPNAKKRENRSLNVLSSLISYSLQYSSSYFLFVIMDASQSSVGQGSTSQATFKRLVPHNRNPTIWCNWDLIELTDNTLKARCKFCGAYLNPLSNSSLKKHIEKPYCPSLKKNVDSQQTQMDSEGGIFSYDVDRVRDRMAKFVIQEGLPFSHFDNPRLTEMIRDTLQPLYNHVSRHTLKRYCLKLWSKAKQELVAYFENINTGINLTSDVWSAPHGLPESYLCVTAHWVDPSSWQMMKRTIAFDFFEYPHTGENLFEILDFVIRSYKIENKIFSMAFDNASNNTTAVEKLKLKYTPLCNGIFYHSRCVAHIINLVVQDGLATEEVQTVINDYRQMIHDVFKKSRKRHTDYRKLCKDTGRKSVGANWDVPHRWNSTCIMFESGLKQRETLQMFHASLAEEGLANEFSNEKWEIIQQLATFLEVFKSSTTRLSGTYYPTSPITLTELYVIVNNLDDFQYKSSMFSNMIEPMKMKFKKYFLELPNVFTCAMALNPIFNLTGVECVIEAIFTSLDMHEIDINFSSDAQKEFNNNFKIMYDFYLIKYGSNIHMPTPGGASSSSAPKVRDPITSFMNTVRNVAAKKQRGNTPSSELGRYQSNDYLAGLAGEDYRTFDVLGWWKGKESEFPVLAAMARDLLTVQASTVASESAFSLSGRVLSMRRTRLTPESLEMCICLKDHLDSIDRVQHVTDLEDDTHLDVRVHDEQEGISSNSEEDVLNQNNL